MSNKKIKKLKSQRKILRQAIDLWKNDASVRLDFQSKQHQEEIGQLQINIKHYLKESVKFKEEAEKTVEELTEYRRILCDCLWWACNGLHPSHMANADLYNGVQVTYVSLQQVLRLCREFAVCDAKSDSLLKYDGLNVSLSIHEEVEQEVMGRLTLPSSHTTIKG